MKTRLFGMFVVSIVLAGAAQAESQLWNDGGADNIWSTNAPNWEAGAVWTNGNSAIFSGGAGALLGETVDISATVTVANVTFQTNGYVIADADNDGTLELLDKPTLAVVNAADGAVVREVIAGTNGFNKTGAGRLQLTATNTFSGEVTVKAGTLRLADNVPGALGATGTGNGTVVEDGATLDVYSAYKVGSNEDIVIKGSGVGGIGALVNTGPTAYYNNGYRNLTLAGDATIGGSQRFDMSGNGAYYGNGYTLTKTGSCQTAISRAVTNSPIIINQGTYTIQHAQALGGADYPTTVNEGAKLDAWGSYTLAERLFLNGCTLSSSGDKINTFKLTGNLTLGGNVILTTEVVPTNTLELAGVLDGVGGFTRSGIGFVVISGDANTYSGPSTVSGGAKLWVGKTVGGTGVLGTGTTTNNGTLYANSAVLSAGMVVNNNSGALYLNPPTLTVGRIVNLSGTVYGTSVVQAANGVVNASTWNSYVGSFGSGTVTNTGTLNLYTNQFVYGQFANGGTLSLWQSMTLSSPITFIGGSLYVNDLSNTLYVTGPVTLAGNASFSGTGSSTTEVSSVLSGPGGIIRSGDGYCSIMNDANDYTGPTVINGGKSLWVGKAGVANGRLGSGAITNNGTLYFDSVGTYTAAHGINGTGTTDIRYGGVVTVDGGVSSNNVFHVANGTLTLTNGALFDVYGAMTVANRDDVFYSPKPTNVVAFVNVGEGCLLRVANVTFGNGGDLTGGTMTGILNQVGGMVRTTGVAAEGNGIRLGHYPQARSFYNMMGGTLIVEGNWDLCCATDGQGWFNMTGGEVFATRVMLNERHDGGGFGHLNVSGGVMNIGTLNAGIGAVTNAITADNTAPYTVEFGGAGGTIRAVTNIFLPLNTTLFGAGTNAITFDSQACLISLSGRLSGAGDFNKSGSGVLTLSNTNTFSGVARVNGGALSLTVANALTNATVAVASGTSADLGGFSQRLSGVGGSGVVSNGTLTVTGSVTPGVDGIGTLTLAVGSAALGGTMTVDVATNGVCDVLSVQGDLALSGITLQVADLAQLAKGKNYTVITFSGTLSGKFEASNVIKPWYILYDRAGHTVQLRSDSGTLLRVL